MWHWNMRIRKLGGKEYNNEEMKAMLLAKKEEVPWDQGGGLDVQFLAGLGLKGRGGYRYFGAAKDLPGVKELFAQHAAQITKHKRGDIQLNHTPDYYGLRDEEDGVLLELDGRKANENQGELKQCREEYTEMKRQKDAVATSGNGGSL